MSVGIRKSKVVSFISFITQPIQARGRALSILSHLQATVSMTLVREEDGLQRPVYFTSRVFRGAEERYP